MNHSPTPWKKVISGGQINIVAADGYDLASIPDPTQPGGRGKEDFANANILIAAPEMLQALKTLGDACLKFQDRIPEGVLYRLPGIADLVAKAEGK